MLIRALRSISLVFLVGIFLSVGSVYAEPVAIVTDLIGQARIESPGELREVNVLDNLEAGQSISLGDAFKLTLVYLESGIEYNYTGPTTFLVGTLAPENVNGEQAQARQLKLLEETGLKPAEGNLNQAAIVFRNVHNFGEKIELLSPRDTKLMAASPIFQWVSLGEGTSYHFELNSSRGQLVFARDLEEAELQLPADIELGYGRKYRWSLSAKLGNESYHGSASFLMGSEGEIEKLNSFRPLADASFSEKIVYALYLKQLGFNQAAKQSWDSLSQQRPDDLRLKSKLQ